MPERNERPNQPRDFGRDGTSGMVDRDRSIRALEVSKPQPPDIAYAKNVVPQLTARVKGRRVSTPPEQEFRH